MAPVSDFPLCPQQREQESEHGRSLKSETPLRRALISAQAIIIKQFQQRTNAVPTGLLKFLDRGFGFITRDDGAEDVFVHEREAQNSGLVLVPGLRIAFDVEMAPKGPRAINLALAP